VRIAYFVHDLTDPAVARRVRMLRAGGADVVLLGFRREAEAPAEIAEVRPVDLGRTYDARFGHRAALTALNVVGAVRLRRRLAGCDVVMARMLETLAIASAARAMSGYGGRLVYECLDVHRMMLGEGVKSRAMRAVERALLKSTDLLVVSSPAFLREYFEPRQGVGRAIPVDTLLVENKVLELEPQETVPEIPTLAPGPPWRIGWLGAIRCRKSLAILGDLAARRPDLVEVRIHGRPAYTEFDDFDAQVAGLPTLTFGGGYTAADLPRLYGATHFAWAIDFMEEGLNSSWLLPNRLYEASRHGAVPLALAGVETGRYLAQHGFGLRLNEPAELEAALDRLTPESYAALRRQVAQVPREALVAGAADCRRLVESLRGPGSSDALSQLSPMGARNGVATPEHIHGGAV
jgi:hypothetical protein